MVKLIDQFDIWAGEWTLSVRLNILASCDCASSKWGTQPPPKFKMTHSRCYHRSLQIQASGRHCLNSKFEPCTSALHIDDTDVYTYDSRSRDRRQERLVELTLNGCWKDCDLIEPAANLQTNASRSFYCIVVMVVGLIIS